jgi:glyoxalase family protein
VRVTVSVQGLHHITLVCSDAQRTVDFYTGVLGLRLVKQTVNFDDPTSFHLYFGDAVGSPGSAVTFFEWPRAPKGAPGVGGTHHFALTVPDRRALLMWKRRLTDLGVAVSGPLDRHYFTSIYLNDPDGTIVELATAGPGWVIDESPDGLGEALRPPPAQMVIRNRDEARIQYETWPEPVPGLPTELVLSRGMHHITAIGSSIERTHAFLSGLLGLRRVKQTTNFDDPGSAHWYWGVGEGQPGTIVTYFERDPQREPPAKLGAGQTHHYALAVPDEAAQLECRERLLKAGLPVTAVLDRVYFRSIYTRDPDGHIVELATAGPGFLVDEPEFELGHRLKLPPWLAARRSEIESRLRRLRVPVAPG